MTRLTKHVFRRKPVEVKARCWDREAAVADLIHWAGPDVLEWHPSLPGPVGPDGEQWGTLRVVTLEGTHVASPGDWLVKGVQGEFYFCKPGVFAATYEPVTVTDGCDDHRPVQHRDARPPWCRNCGLTAGGAKPVGLLDRARP